MTQEQANQANYEKWKKAVDAILESEIGISVDDMVDMPLRDEFDSGTTPAEMVESILADIEELM